MQARFNALIKCYRQILFYFSLQSIVLISQFYVAINGTVKQLLFTMKEFSKYIFFTYFLFYIVSELDDYLLLLSFSTNIFRASE